MTETTTAILLEILNISSSIIMLKILNKINLVLYIKYLTPGASPQSASWRFPSLIHGERTFCIREHTSVAKSWHVNQHIRGGSSPESTSTTRVPPMIVFMMTRALPFSALDAAQDWEPEGSPRDTARATRAP